MKRIFAFTGLPGVGKSAVAKKFAEDNDLPVVNMGEEMKKQYQSLPIAGEHSDAPDGTWEMAQALRAELGSAGPALASTSRVSAAFTESDTVVVDGVRSIPEVHAFEDHFGCPVHLVSVTADHETRLRRYAERAGYFEEFGEGVALAIGQYEMQERTERECAEGLADAIEWANYSIDNNGSLEDAARQCARLADDFRPLIEA